MRQMQAFMKEAFTCMVLMHGFSSYVTTRVPNGTLDQSNLVERLGRDKHSMYSAVQILQIAD